MKPSRPEVVSGLSVGGQRGDDPRGEPRALTSLPVAKPGWTSTPVISTIASSAVNVSSWSSPSVEPSIV